MSTTLTTPRCIECGKFVATEDPDARYYFEPDNHFGPEVNEWTCGPCKRRRTPARPSEDGGEHS